MYKYTCLHDVILHFVHVFFKLPAGMSGSWKKQRLQDHFVVLCNELNVSLIVPILRAERMLTSDEMEQLQNSVYTTRQRREKLLIIIPHKGRSHFEKFAECLVWSGQTDLARKIGVPVKDIRPSPHPRKQTLCTCAWCVLARCTCTVHVHNIYIHV